jgi:hypothetical protein
LWLFTDLFWGSSLIQKFLSPSQLLALSIHYKLFTYRGLEATVLFAGTWSATNLTHRNNHSGAHSWGSKPAPKAEFWYTKSTQQTSIERMQKWVNIITRRWDRCRKQAVPWKNPGTGRGQGKVILLILYLLLCTRGWIQGLVLYHVTYACSPLHDLQLGSHYFLPNWPETEILSGITAVYHHAKHHFSHSKAFLLSELKVQRRTGSMEDRLTSSAPQEGPWYLQSSELAQGKVRVLEHLSHCVAHPS